MTLVFIFYWFILFILAVSVILLLSRVRFSVKNLEIQNKEFNEEKIDIDDLWKYLDINFSINISIYLLNKIKIFQYIVNKEKAKKLKIDQKIKKLNYEKVKEEVELDFDREIFDRIKKINFKIEEFKMRLKIGSKSPIATSYLVAIISIVVSMGLAKFIKRVEPNKHKYEISPLYVNKNKFNFNLNCIIYANLVHIIFIIFIFLRKRRVKIYERASNRRVNDDSNGQYSGYGGRKYNNRRANPNI